MLIEAFHSYANLLHGLGYNIRKCTIRVNLSRGDRVEYAVLTTYHPRTELSNGNIIGVRDAIARWFDLAEIGALYVHDEQRLVYGYRLSDDPLTVMYRFARFMGVIES